MEVVYNLEGYGRKWYSQIIEQGRGADQCVECGSCEEKCPQHIEIIRQLKETHRHFTEK